MGGLLFDASSLLASVKLGRIGLLFGERVQWLTLYELCNALWKESNLLGRLTGEEVVRLVEVVGDIVGNMVVVGVRGSEVEVVEMALSTGLSAYDASYIVLAGKGDLTLVTEDERLRREASKHVPAASVLQLSNQPEP